MSKVGEFARKRDRLAQLIDTLGEEHGNLLQNLERARGALDILSLRGDTAGKHVWLIRYTIEGLAGLAPGRLDEMEELARDLELMLEA